MTTYEIGIVCGEQHQAFKQCKTQRNAIIFEEIKKWEKNKFSDFELHEKKEHLDNIQSSLQEKKEALEKVAARAKNTNIIYRKKSDIKQLEWRLRYLSAITN